MKKPGFFHNIKYLSDAELKSFGKYLLDPHSTTINSLHIVFKIVKRYIINVHLGSYENLHAIISRNTRYSEKTINKILSRLNVSLKSFSRLEALKSSNYLSDYSYCNYLLKHENRAQLKENLKALSEFLEEKDNLDHDFFHKMFEFNILEYSESITDEENLNTGRSIDRQKYLTLEANKNLWVYTIAKSILNLTNLVFQTNGFDEFKKNEFHSIINNLFISFRENKYKQFNKKQKLTLLLFQKLFTMLNNPYDTKSYIEYSNYFKNIRSSYNLEFNKTHHSILMNFCFLLNRLSGVNFYKREITYNLYYYIEMKYYINNKTKYLHPIIYKNFVINCMNSDNKVLLKRFIHNHTKSLNPKDIKEMSSFAFCHYYYLNNEYTRSIDTAETIKNPKGFYKYDIYNILIKNYFEVSDYFKAEELLHNYKFFISTDNLLSETDKAKFTLMIDYVKTFLILKSHYDSNNDIFNFEFLLDRIRNEKPFFIKNWLTLKLENIISNHYQKTKEYKILSLNSSG